MRQNDSLRVSPPEARLNRGGAAFHAVQAPADDEDPPCGCDCSPCTERGRCLTGCPCEEKKRTLDVLHGRDDDVRSLLDDVKRMRGAMVYAQGVLGRVQAFGDDLGPNVTKAELGTAHNRLSAVLASVRS